MSIGSNGGMILTGSNPEPLLCKACPQLTTLNLNHFNVVEDIGLKIIASRYP
jgi:hypothetical protein